MAKLRIGLLFGGRSVEHEVSLVSAASILKALDPTRYDVGLIGVDHDGRWHLAEPTLPEEVIGSGEEVTLPAVPGGRRLVSTRQGDLGPIADLDVIFPVIHGRGGEDGTLQGLLELADVPYVGSGVLGSALQMDKEVAKRLLRAAKLPVVPWVTVRSKDLATDAVAVVNRVRDALAFPVFVKPANLGSSVGTSQVESTEALLPALREAARYDTKILVERAVDAREIEVAILGNDRLEASVPGEIVTGHDFYDYEAKYIDGDTELLVPAPLSEEQKRVARELALEAVRVLEGEGLARVDFLLDRHSDEFFISEVNSIPGFTEGSMYPRLWNASGLAYPALLDRLIELAIERHRTRSGLETLFKGGAR